MENVIVVLLLTTSLGIHLHSHGLAAVFRSQKCDVWKLSLSYVVSCDGQHLLIPKLWMAALSAIVVEGMV